MLKTSGILMKVFLIVVLLVNVLFAQKGEKKDIWKPFEFFVDKWEGKVEGKYGEGKIDLEFSFVLRGVYLQLKNKTVFEPQEKNPAGEVHQDFGFFSYDEEREKFVLRQFNVEGFVNQYALDSLSEDGKTLVFITENIENISSGWRARLTYKILNANEFQQIFELAPPEKDFEVCTEAHLKRKQ
jgi:hypothetical protein